MEIARVFFDVHMSLNFQGLSRILKDHKIKPETLDTSDLVIFMNRKMTKFKLLIGQNYLVYHSNGNKRVNLEAIQYFPQFFDGKRLDFKAAEKRALERKYHSLS